jgi:hypothetical protein
VAALADGHVAKAVELTDRQQQLLDEVSRARGGVKRIPNGLAWRDYVAEELARIGLITCRINGGKRHLQLVAERKDDR